MNQPNPLTEALLLKSQLVAETRTAVELKSTLVFVKYRWFNGDYNRGTVGTWH
jgi:hypothetical protein